MRWNFILIIILFSSCSTKEAVFVNSNSLVENFDDINIKVYEEIEKFINDGRSTNVKSLMSYVFGGDNSYQIDSFLLFDETKTKCFTTINYKNFWPGSTSDKIDNLYGVKIESKWHFFMGSVLVLPRRYYQYDSYEHLTFEEISYLAHDMRHKHFLIDKGSNKYIVNHEKINNYIKPRNICGVSQTDPRPINEIYTSEYYDNLNDTLSTEEINKILANKEKAKAEFVWKPTPKPKKTPIFESKAWKNRHKEN